MKRAEMMALLNHEGNRPKLERAIAWLLARLGESRPGAAGWVQAREIEAARSCTGVSEAAMKRARRWLLNKGYVEKRRNGFQGPWMYRLVNPEARHCPLCGAVNGVPARAPVEQVSAPEPVQPHVAIRYIGRGETHADRLHGTGLMWHGYGDIKPIADRHKAQRMAQCHPDIYELVEIEPD